MTKPKNNVKFQHREARRASRPASDEKDGSPETSPTENGQLHKPEVSRNQSYEAAWTDDEKASKAC